MTAFFGYGLWWLRESMGLMSGRFLHKIAIYPMQTGKQAGILLIIETQADQGARQPNDRNNQTFRPAHHHLRGNTVNGSTRPRNAALATKMNGCSTITITHTKMGSSLILTFLCGRVMISNYE